MNPEQTEFSRPVRVDQIPAAGMDLDVTAKPAERAALARRFGIPAVESLAATVRLKSIAGGTLVRVSGSLVAEVVQTCVVSLEPVPQRVEDSFSLNFSAGAVDMAEGGEVELSLDDEDPPEPIVGGAVDVGEVVAEHLALALDPFPRKPGVAFEQAGDAPPEVEERPNPFAVLAGLRKNKG